MKIAQIAPLIESVPPRLYGGTERIVSYLTEELAKIGHDVTLFASGDSITSAELAPCCTRALRLDSTVGDIIPHFMLMIDKVRERAHEFDILHFHIDLVHFPLFRSLAARTLTTLHGRQDLGDLKPFYFRFSEMPLVSISNYQRKPLPHAHFVATVYHGIPADLHLPSLGQGSYLAFLGRISPEKRPDRAIRIARAAGMPLKIAAKVDKADEDYFRNDIRPLLDGPGVEFIGEINEREKAKFLGEPTKDRRAGATRKLRSTASHGSERGKGRDEIWRAGCAVGRTACENLDHAAGRKDRAPDQRAFSTTVGEIVPGTVHLYSLPVSILEYAPQYRDYEYILVGDEILIVDPRTLRIVRGDCRLSRKRTSPRPNSEGGSLRPHCAQPLARLRRMSRTGEGVTNNAGLKRVNGESASHRKARPCSLFSNTAPKPSNMQNW